MERKYIFYRILIWVSVLFLFVDCNPHRAKKADLGELQLIDTVNMKRSFLKELSRHVIGDKDCDIFLLKSTMLYKRKKGWQSEINIGKREIYNEIFVIIRAGKYAIGEGEFVFSRNYPSQYFILNGKTILVLSENDAFHNQVKLEKIYNEVVNREYLRTPKHYLLVSDNLDYTEVLTEKEIYSSHDFNTICDTHKVDIYFKAPSKKENR